MECNEMAFRWYFWGFLICLEAKIVNDTRLYVFDIHVCNYMQGIFHYMGYFSTLLSVLLSISACVLWILSLLSGLLRSTMAVIFGF